MTMTTSQASYPVLLSSSQPFLIPAFAVPRRQQSPPDYPTLALFTSAEQAQQQELQGQQLLAAASQALPPSQSSFQRSATPSLSLNMSPKLPSLDSLLRQMQTNSPITSAASTPQHSLLSPVSRNLPTMPFQRTVISPNTKKRLFYATTMPQTLLPSMTSLSMQQSGSLKGPTFLEKRHSWSDYPATSKSPSICSHKTYRSRALKYCRIEGCERVSQRNNLCHSHGGKRLCKEEGCLSKDRGNGFCIKHGGGKICSMLDCEKKARRKGLCTQHFRDSGRQ